MYVEADVDIQRLLLSLSTLYTEVRSLSWDQSLLIWLVRLARYAGIPLFYHHSLLVFMWMLASMDWSPAALYPRSHLRCPNLYVFIVFFFPQDMYLVLISIFMVYFYMFSDYFISSDLLSMPTTNLIFIYDNILFLSVMKIFYFHLNLANILVSILCLLFFLESLGTLLLDTFIEWVRGVGLCECLPREYKGTKENVLSQFLSFLKMQHDLSWI